MLLALLAVGLPTAALASGIDYNTGKFERGTINGSFTTSIIAKEVGSLATITIDTGTLTKLPKSDCSKGFMCYDFSGGSVTVTHKGSTLFTDSLKGGVVKVRKGEDSADIIATLLPDATLKQGTAVAILDWGHRREHNRFEHHDGQSDDDHDGHDRHARRRDNDHRTVHAGDINVSLAATTVPEPGTLGMLGTGLIGLAGIARRKITRET